MNLEICVRIHLGSGVWLSSFTLQHQCLVHSPPPHLHLCLAMAPLAPETTSVQTREACGSKRVAECSMDIEKPCKQAKTNASSNLASEIPQSRWSGLKAVLTPWRWFQRGSKDKSPPKSLKLTGCSTKPLLNGIYQCAGDTYAHELDHNRPTYVKESGAYFCYFWSGLMLNTFRTVRSSCSMFGMQSL